MAEVTYFVALPFVAADEGLAPGEPVECFNPSAAVMRAEALSRKLGHVGAVAFSRTGDPATGDFSDAQVIRKFGEVTGDLLGCVAKQSCDCLCRRARSIFEQAKLHSPFGC